MNISIISFSARGYELSENLARTLSNTNGKDKYHVTWERCRPGKLHSWTGENFSRDALIFIGSCGIAVRAIAPFVKSKVSDPAVIVMDERGKYCISLLSGHIGGANRLVRILAELTGAEPVITTATDLNNLFSVDEWASSQGMKIINPGNIVKTADKLLNGETIFLKSLVPVGGAGFLEDLPWERHSPYCSPCSGNGCGMPEGNQRNENPGGVLQGLHKRKHPA